MQALQPSNAALENCSNPTHTPAKRSSLDALIVRAALEGGASVLYSEDLQHGQGFETLRVQNPLQ